MLLSGRACKYLQDMMRFLWRLKLPCFLALVKFHKILQTFSPEKVFLSRMSLDGNKFFIISQSLVTQFIFGSISNHKSLQQTRSLVTIYMKEKTRGKKLEKFIEFDLSTLRFRTLGKWEKKVVERCQNNYTRRACNQ